MNSKPIPELGNLVWCIRPSIEEEQHGNTAPVRPWQGIVTRRTVSAILGNHVWISRFDESGKPDEDENATACCFDWYWTREEARTAFLDAVEAHVSKLMSDALKLQEMMKEERGE
jgi:hypothetical protein